MSNTKQIFSFIDVIIIMINNFKKKYFPSSFFNDIESNKSKLFVQNLTKIKAKFKIG